MGAAETLASFLRQKPLNLGIASLAVSFLIILPFITSNAYLIYLLSLMFIFGVAALSLDVVIGRLGMFNFAHAAVFGVGGYTSAMLAKYLELPVPGTILLGAASAVLMAFPIGMIGLRLHGPYFAISTIALAEILRLTYLRILDDWTYGESGLWGIPPLPKVEIGLLSVNFSDSSTAQYFLFLALLLATMLFLSKLYKTRLGLYFLAVREDEIAAKSLGINTVRYKLLGFLISSFLAGLAGAVYAHWIQTFSPALMSISQTVFFIAMVLIGGVNTTFGPLVGSFVNVLILEFLKYGRYHFIIFGLLIIAVTLVFPKGIVGTLAQLLGGTQTKSKLRDK